MTGLGILNVANVGIYSLKMTICVEVSLCLLTLVEELDTNISYVTAVLCKR